MVNACKLITHTCTQWFNVCKWTQDSKGKQLAWERGVGLKRRRRKKGG